tara:strand:+ start:34588 stop:35091 length:504 start_codon:yes stop_codon:yes gene_type:complete
MKTNQRIRKIAITDRLTLGANAIVRKKVGNDYAVVLPALASQVLTTTKAVTADESGTHFVLNTATAFVTTLPAPVAGMEFWFHIGATEPTTSHTVVTDASANIIVGNLVSPEDALGSVATVTDADTISFIASKAVHGDFAHVWSDGTNWYLDGMCKVQDGMTTTQAS